MPIRIWNFVSHFIHIQIFQMEILALSLILYSSKYSRYICGDKVDISKISLFISKHMKLKFVLQIKGELNPLKCCKYLIQVSGPQKFVKQIFQPLNLYFPGKTVLFSNAILSFFLDIVYIFILKKIIAQRSRIHLFFYIHCNLVKLSAPTSSNFFGWKYGTLGTQKEQQIWIGDFFGWDTDDYFCLLFAPFYSRGALNP